MEFIQKRDGSISDFDSNKIVSVIQKAADSVGKKDFVPAKALSELVCDYLELLETNPVHVETVSDYIEKVLMEEGYNGIAKNFILYRYKRSQIRERKERRGVIDDCKLGFNAIRILESRYLQRDKQGEIIETPKQLFERVAKHVALAESKFVNGDVNENAGENVSKYYDLFLEMLMARDFLPNSPMLLNAGKKDGLISSICALPLGDSTESIFSTLKNTAIIHKRGAGTGFSFSQIRPKRDPIRKKPGIASGPIEFLKLFDRSTTLIRQGCVRPGGNMAILRVDHPDIIDFITIKDDRDTISNYNLSVGITSDFMRSLKQNKEYSLYNPRTGETAGSLSAKRIFDLICLMAWKNGDPGIVFLDRINSKRNNPTPKIGKHETTSPCGEYPMLPFESVVLGSINLANHLKKVGEENSLEKSGSISNSVNSSQKTEFVGLDGRYEVDFEKLERTVKLAVRFLDNATEVNVFPLREIAEIVSKNRKIGLGIMGFSDMLIKLWLPYNSDEALSLASKLMKFINAKAKEASLELAKERGVFPNYEDSVYVELGEKGKFRNATITAISPTGTISYIASCSPSIEPLYGVSFLRKTAQFEFIEVNPYFEEVARRKGFYSEEIFRKVAGRTSIQALKEIPKDVRRVFVTAMDIKPEDHVKMQAAFQKNIDNAVSKTVNFPHNVSVDDIQKVYLLAYELGCKGLTVYRDGSLDYQVLNSR